MGTAQSGLLAEPLKPAIAFEHLLLIVAFVILLLLLDIFSDRCFIPANGRYQIASRFTQRNWGTGKVIVDAPVSILVELHRIGSA